MAFSFDSRTGGFVVLVAAALAACGCGSAASLCDDFCDCQGCSDTERDDCVDDIEDAEKRAEEAGCEQQFDELVDCMDDQLECRDGRVDADGCESETKDLSECSDGEVGGPSASACDTAVELCGGTPGEEEVDCTGATLCTAQCIVSASSCDLNNMSLQQCVSDCAN